MTIVQENQKLTLRWNDKTGEVFELGSNGVWKKFAEANPPRPTESGPYRIVQGEFAVSESSLTSRAFRFSESSGIAWYLGTNKVFQRCQ